MSLGRDGVIKAQGSQGSRPGVGNIQVRVGSPSDDWGSGEVKGFRIVQKKGTITANSFSLL